MRQLQKLKHEICLRNEYKENPKYMKRKSTARRKFKNNLAKGSRGQLKDANILLHSNDDDLQGQSNELASKFENYDFTCI
ncbi:22054_t:CDS:2 [Gigaspora rosea]|nr:22054_t:CDS:2 [Gigaspora rosea]